MNWKNVIALILTIVIAAVAFGFAAANAEASDNIEYISELLDIGYSWFDSTEDTASSYDIVAFSEELLTITTKDAGSRVTNYWTFENKLGYYMVLNALINNEQSTCAFVWITGDDPVIYMNTIDDAMIYLTATITAYVMIY